MAQFGFLYKPTQLIMSRVLVCCEHSLSLVCQTVRLAEWSFESAKEP